MKHYGDITKINGAEAPVVDIITGGSPCQDLSVAGKRAGLAGERSGLFMEQMRIVKEMRERERATGRTSVNGWTARARSTGRQIRLDTRLLVILSPCRFGNGWQDGSAHSMSGRSRWQACLTASADSRLCSSGAEPCRYGPARLRSFLSP